MITSKPTPVTDGLPNARVPVPPKVDPNDPEMKIAVEFEATFIAEMLKHSGLNKTSSAFGGGPGEDAFSSMLTQNYAQALAGSGGIGLAKFVYNAINTEGKKL